MLNTQEKATNAVKLVTIDPYTREDVRIGGNIKFERLNIFNKDEIEFISDQQIDKEEEAKQNAVLALFTTPRMFADSNTPAPPIQVLAVYSHASFVHAFNLLSNEEKKEMKVLRSYWIGDGHNMPKIRESSDVDKVVSDLLVEHLAEKVRLYKANVRTGRLAPFKKTLDPAVFEGGVEYVEHLEQFKSKSKYDLEIIKKLAEGKKPKAVSDRAFAFTTPVITDAEIERVLKLVAEKPEPTLPYRPTSINQAEAIANAIKDALQPQTLKGEK